MILSVKQNRLITRVLPEKWAEISGGNGVYKRYFDHEKVIFIHTPKTAGTSISKVLYGEDPWHFSAEDLRFFNAKKFESYKKVGFTRNPFARLHSTFHYAKKWIKKNPKTAIAFVDQYDDFQEFILKGIEKKLVHDHYFFWSYFKYLSIDGQLAVDAVGRFETLVADCELLLAIDADQLPRLNESKQKESYKESFTDEMKQKVFNLYEDDFKAFSYEF